MKTIIISLLTYISLCYACSDKPNKDTSGKTASRLTQTKKIRPVSIDKGTEFSFELDIKSA